LVDFTRDVKFTFFLLTFFKFVYKIVHYWENVNENIYVYSAQTHMYNIRVNIFYTYN